MNLTRALIVTIVIAAGTRTDADVSVPAMFSDHMVLQRRMEVPIFGNANANERITLTITGVKGSGGSGGESQLTTTRADDKGAWRAKFQPLEAPGPYRITIKGEAGKPIEIFDVLAGEVWVCSGQSNMQWSVKDSANPADEIAKADYPQIRLFQVPIKGSAEPLKKVEAKWVLCTKQTIPDFTAVGYFFGRELHQNLRVPVGLIQSAVGGTPAESWTPRQELLAHDQTKEMVERTDKLIADYPKAKAEFDKKIAEWNAKSGANENKGEAQGWQKTGTDLADWKPMKLPQFWSKGGLAGNGVVWFRRDVDLPESWSAQELSLQLGAIDDQDVTYFNGEKVGETGKGNPWAAGVKRKYKVPGALVKAGKNTIVIRVLDTGGEGGMVGPEPEMKLAPTAAQAKPPISLAGDWLYKVETLVPANSRPNEPIGPGNAWTASALYNAMVNPLVPYGIRGAIWYQGESNADRAAQYKVLFPAMIQGWRRSWGQGDFPFLFVQLANFSLWQPATTQPRDSTWAELREAQTHTLKTVPKTGMALAIDIGDSADIHPKNKQEVGRRLALAARANVYGQKETVYSGPMYESMKVDGDKIRVKFTEIHGGLMPKDNTKLQGFAVAGADKKFVWADAKIDGDSVIVSSPDVKEPVAVRYGWDNDPKLNLFNKAGLPASPFRTDDWVAAPPKK